MLREAEGCRPAPYLASRGMKWIQSYGPGLGKRELKEYLKASHALVAAGLSRKKRAELGLIAEEAAAPKRGGNMKGKG